MKEKHEINTIEFIKAGKAIFTVSNDKNEHYTYRINHPNDTAPYFVQLLTGPDNTGDYTYIGLFNDRTLDIILTHKSKMTTESKPVKVLKWAVKMVAEKKTLPAGYHIMHEGRCGRCGRVLTTPESVVSGFGPYCDGRMG